MRFLKGIVVFGLMLCSSFLLAQKTAAYLDSDRLFYQGLELFEKKQFASAQKTFNDYIGAARSSLLKNEAVFYSAACGIELFNKDGEWQMKQFIENHPESKKVNSGWFYLGKSNFRKKKYPETIEYLEKVDIYQLDKDQLSELYFKRGYSYLQEKKNDKAKIDLYEIKDVDNKYAHPANYYYSHIAYEEKNYEIAMSGFKRLVGNETFGSVVPYYITQIYFIQGKYDVVVKEAPLLLNDSNNVQKAGEINRMIGESYFNLKDYGNALVFLKKTDLGTNPQGNYAIGYCYYKTGDCGNAIKHFEESTVVNDSIAQNAWYHMADCYLKTGEKLKAKNAYFKAYQLDFDPAIKEDALFSFAKLGYELDFSPYNEAVRAFTKYLKEYPNSPKKEECYNYLINVYSTTKNYDQAIRSIESLDNIDPILKVTYQKLIYFKAVEHFNNNELDNAEKQFKKSLTQNSDLKLNALSQYWLGEIAYIRKDYSTAIDYWKKFQLLEGAVQLKEYDLSNYAIGYAYFQRKDKEDYTNASVSFRKFLLSAAKQDERKVNDANLRTADCFFMNRDFLQASDYYKKSIEGGRIDVDYALYQKGLCNGLNKKYEDKIAEMKRIESRFPASNYYCAALNEIADTYLQNLKDQDNAILYYEKVLKNFPNSSFTSNCYAQLGNIYYERKQDDKAFEYYDKFVRLDSRSEAAKEVLESIKKIFTEKGKIDEMEKYFASIGNPLSENELEKKTYLVAYDLFYEKKNCDLALPQWESYITKFPNGKYINEAYFVTAECYYGKGNYEKALNGYRFVLEKPRGLYSETSCAKASYIYFKDKKYAEALPLFQMLQEIAETPSNKSAGKFGAMRCAFSLSRYDVALQECTKVLNTEKLSPQQTSEANYIKAKSLFETNRLDDAMLEFRNIVKTAKNQTGAEAYYHIARIQFTKQEYKEVEKTVNKLISYDYTNDDWNNKGMLLLADAYLAKGDEADAIVILEVIIDGKPKQEYIDAANKKLAEIKEKQKQRQESELRSKDENGMKVEFQQSASDNEVQNNLNKESQPAEETKEKQQPEQPK